MGSSGFVGKSATINRKVVGKTASYRGGIYPGIVIDEIMESDFFSSFFTAFLGSPEIL